MAVATTKIRSETDLPEHNLEAALDSLVELYDEAYNRNRESARAKKNNDLTEAALDLGFQYLSCGAYRDVFVYADDRFGRDPLQEVVKIQREPHGKDNETEWVAWTTAPDSTRELLCPAIDASDSYRWVRFKRAEVPTSIDKRHRLKDEYRERIRETSLDISDLHKDNIGMIEHRVVALDYGFGVSEYLS